MSQTMTTPTDVAEEITDTQEPLVRVDKKGLKRNGLWLAGIVIVAVAAFAWALAARKTPEKAPQTTVGITAGGVGVAVDEVSQRDKDRLARTTAEDAQTSLDKGKSFIPTALPSEMAPPPTNNSGVLPAYDYRAGANTASTGSAALPSDVKKAIETQLGEIITARSAPPTGRAEPYVVPKDDAGSSSQAQGRPANQVGSAPVTAAAGQELAGKPLVGSLYITTARLVSALDTANTGFVSAEVDSGPLAGAYLIGQAAVSGDSGVRVVFRQMRHQGETYAINATGLDVVASNDALKADIDRKIFARYVMPIFFSTAQAYLGAKANPGQTVVLGGDGATIATPAATAKQAAAAGVAAGIGKAGEAVAQANQGPNTAYLPVNSSLGVMFLDPVVAKGVRK